MDFLNESFLFFESLYVVNCTGSSKYTNLGGILMKDKINFNVIEKNKTDNTKDIQKAINIIMNKLITRQFVNLQQ